LVQKARFKNILSTRNTPHIQRHTQTKNKRLERDLQDMQKLKTSRIAILILNKADSTQKLVRRVKEGHYVLIKVTIYQQDIKVLNIYALNIMPQVHKRSTPVLEGTDKTRYNNSGKSQCPMLFIRHNIQTKNQQRYPLLIHETIP
jgi:hypothetical protein